MTEDRMVCRNELGHVRLMPSVTIVDALERLLAIEERAGGVVVVRTGGAKPYTGHHCRDCRHYCGPDRGSGICEVHPSRDNRGVINGMNRRVAAARIACADKYEAK
ncbi:MAG: hypothetical protein IJK29_10930 [Bacteroidales bacterium]|nr:hypothetical protein [Bacteroidales bacterium]